MENERGRLVIGLDRIQLLVASFFQSLLIHRVILAMENLIKYGDNLC